MFDFLAAEGVGIEAHGLFIAEDGMEGGSVFGDHFAEDQAGSTECRELNHSVIGFKHGH